MSCGLWIFIIQIIYVLEIIRKNYVGKILVKKKEYIIVFNMNENCLIKNLVRITY